MTKVIGDYNAAVSIDGSTHYLLIQPGSSSTPYNKINRNTLLGVSGQPADISTSQTLTNKVLGNTNTVTVKDTLFTLQDDGDTSKQAQFQLSGITTATTRTYTLPDASTTLVGASATQTLTNKTLTSPTITGGTYDNGTITVDSIGGHTSANIVTVAGLQINNGILNTNNSVVTASIADTAVTPAKLQSGTGSGWSWSSWSPTLTNVTIGNGTLEAKYIQSGKTVFGRISVLFGTTTTISGAFTFSLPVTSVAYGGGGGQPYLGGCRILDAGINAFQASVFWSTTTTANVQVMVASGTYVTFADLSSTVPMTWGNADGFALDFIYEAA